MSIAKGETGGAGGAGGASGVRGGVAAAAASSGLTVLAHFTGQREAEDARVELVSFYSDSLVFFFHC